MIYELGKPEDLQAVYNVVQHTIKTIYPKYYPMEVVDFFCEHHSEDAIEKDINNGYVSVLKIDGTIVATGCFVDNHITRVYVLPEHQKKGYGTFIMKNIEEQIGEKFDKAYLDASLPAAALYEKLGFVTVMHERYPVENGVILAYEVMEKELHKISTDINYDGRKFIPKMNSENGEVGEQTNFTYHQNGNLLWAEYSGGDILKGSLIGTVLCNGELDFVYHHMNQNMQIKTGKCHSVPTVQENGKIELSEQWQWTSGDYSKGESLLVEVFEYKRATMEDIDELVRTRIIVLRAANKLSDDEDMSVVEEESYAYYRRALETGEHIAYLVYDNGKFIGAGGVSFYQVMPTYHNPTGKKAYIMNMYTAPEYRRQGIAIHALDLLVKNAKKQGVSQIALEATAMGRPLYERYGFMKMEDEMELKE